MVKAYNQLATGGGVMYFKKGTLGAETINKPGCARVKGNGPRHSTPLRVGERHMRNGIGTCGGWPWR